MLSRRAVSQTDERTGLCESSDNDQSDALPASTSLPSQPVSSCTAAVLAKRESSRYN
jgi:hypothetical protein